MKLFCKPYNIRNSDNPLDDMLKELTLFKQTDYCYNYAKKIMPGKGEEELKEYAEIASASFRQAYEFYNSANETYITTSPLLYSYCVNNFVKGLIYLCNPNLSKYFNEHGFVVSNEKIDSTLLNSCITVKQSGPPTAILKLLGNHVIEKQEISFKNLIDHIPSLNELYVNTAFVASSTAIWKQNIGYEMKCFLQSDIEQKMDEINEIGLVGNYWGRTNSYYCNITMAGRNKIIESNSSESVYYKDSIIFPLKLKEGIFSINVMFYAYLIVMSYGMLVRYNAYKWEKFIDPKVSNEAVLISESLIQSVNIVIMHVHKILFGYTYEHVKFNEQDVKQVINNSTKIIMKNIKKELEEDSMRKNHKITYPW